MKAFFDIDTQIDFVFPAGALYSPGAERVIPRVATLNRYAGANGIPLISTMCAHPEDSAEFHIWPPHCVIGTVGQRKPAATILPARERQMVIEKDELDLFSNPRVPELLQELAIDECFVYGVLTEYCVKLAITGLLARGLEVRLVRDAIEHHSEPEGLRVIADFIGMGGTVITSSEIIPTDN
jgi:nicotinamidase/pyrazinamidase